MISLRVPFYGALVYVSITDDPVMARTEAANIFGPYELAGSDIEAVCARTDAGNFGVFFAGTRLTPGVIAHELFHLSVHIATWAHIDIDPNNHEAVAYLHGWLADEVHKLLELYRKSKPPNKKPPR